MPWTQIPVLNLMNSKGTPVLRKHAGICFKNDMKNCCRWCNESKLATLLPHSLGRPVINAASFLLAGPESEYGIEFCRHIHTLYTQLIGVKNHIKSVHR